MSIIHLDGSVNQALFNVDRVALVWRKGHRIHAVVDVGEPKKVWVDADSKEEARKRVSKIKEEIGTS